MTPGRDRDLKAVLADVRRIAVRTTRLVNGPMAGGYRSIFRGKGAEFDQVREYVEGDDPRTVDWNVTARTGKPYVKQHIDERNLTVVFVLDTSRSMSATAGFASPREIAARVIATIGLSAAKANDQVGMVSTGDPKPAFAPIDKGPAHVLRIVRDTLYRPAANHPDALKNAFDFVSGVVRRRAIVFVLSDFLAGGWERSLRILARRHDVVAVRIFGPECDPLPRALVRIREPESGRIVLVDGRDPLTAARWIERQEDFRREQKECFRRAHTDVMEVPIPRDHAKDVVARPILAFFRMRAERGAKR